MPTSIARFTLVLACLVSLQPLSARQQVFRSGTELVEVDVVVLDSTGRLVRGLTADDFELYDEGERQDVSTFSFVEVDPEWIAAGTAATSEPALASSQANRAAAVYLIVLDYIYSPPQRRTAMRDAAKTFVLKNMRSGDLAAVINLGLSSSGVEFSGSKAQLLAAIDRIGNKGSYSGENPTPTINTDGTEVPVGSQPDDGGSGAPSDDDVFNVSGLARIEDLIEASTAEKTYEMLEVAAEYVSGFTGRRKSMLLFSSGVPIDMAYVASEPTGETGLGKREQSARFAEAHRHLVDVARQSNVAVYTIDTLGLNSDAMAMGGQLSGHYEGAPDRSVFALAGTMVESRAEALQALALDTGGRAILRHNEMTAPFAQIARDNGSFYLLGFRPESSDPKKFRRLEVKVKRDDVQVFARMGYGGETKRNAKLAAVLARAWEGETVADLLERPLPGRSSGLSMRAQAAVIERTATGATALLMVEVDPGGIPANATRLEVGYRAIGADGTPAAARIDATNMQVSPRTRAAIDTHGWRYLTTIELPPGPYQLRVAAREETSGAYGTVFLDVHVPDLSRETIAIDSVVIGSTQAAATPTAAPQRDLLQTWPVLPTATRTFGQDETLVAFIQVSTLQVEHATVRVEIEAADGRYVAGSTYEAGPESLKTGGAPIAHQIPLTTFAPGSYVLKIAVTPPNAPEPAARHSVAFGVVRR